MQDILDLLMSNKVYMLAAGAVALFLVVFLLKKLFKMAMFMVLIALAYGAFLYMTEDDPKKVIQSKLDSGKSTMKELDDATRELRDESIDKVINEVDKKLKEAAKKK